MKKEIGKQIKTYRKQKGYKIANMVEETGINKSNYSQIENGKVNFTIDSLSKVCDVLNLSVKLEEQKRGQKQRYDLLGRLRQ